MKKYFVLAIVIALLSVVSSAEAAVAISKDGTYVGEATTINAGRAVNDTFDGSTVTLLANGHKTGVTINVSDESVLTSAALAYGYVRKVEVGEGGATGELVSLANGTPGQMVTFELTTFNVCPWVITDDGVNPSAMTKTGWDDITFNTSGDTITLLYMDDINGWIIIGNNGCTITY